MVRAVGGDDDRWWSEPTGKGDVVVGLEPLEALLWRQWTVDAAAVRAVRGGATGRGQSRPGRAMWWQCEEAVKAAVDAAVVRAVEGDDDSDGRSRPGKATGSTATVRQGVRRMNGSGRFVETKSSTVDSKS
ncbi:hypothetical protein Scep_028073 [Stephania cephalantha]|uniref:Uncharacterized protein n=1 Tax=Stephania cephalantha TaxID=152367 RepID=A0AAP0E993_9MAGN